MSVALVSGETVQIRLSPEGMTALAAVFEEPAFEAKSVGSDEMGLWIDIGSESALLLKWQYLATMVVSLPVQESGEIRNSRIGF
jgi:hypothetical protein